AVDEFAAKHHHDVRHGAGGGAAGRGGQHHGGGTMPAARAAGAPATPDVRTIRTAMEAPDTGRMGMTMTGPMAMAAPMPMPMPGARPTAPMAMHGLELGDVPEAPIPYLTTIDEIAHAPHPLPHRDHTLHVPLFFHVMSGVRGTPVFQSAPLDAGATYLSPVFSLPATYNYIC